MRAWLRLLTVWFIAIALPVQGIAGVSMAHCGASHERMMAAIEAAPHHADPDHALAHDARVAHHHDADTPHVDDRPDTGTADSAEPQTGKRADPSQFKCSACAACGAGSALPSSSPRLPEPMTAPAVFADAVVTVDAFASDGPDRPPRFLLV